jgi:ABC-type lipoprotein release transport system permease subunit
MSSLLIVLPIVVRRVRANARLLLAVVVGAILAAALMSTTAIYTDAIRDLGLSYAIRQLGPDDTNVAVLSSSQTSQLDNYKRNSEFLDAAIAGAIGPLVDEPPTAFGRSATFFPTAPGEPVSASEDRPRSNLQFLTNLEPHIRVVEGRLPGDAAPASGAPAIELALGQQAAGQAGLKIGDRIDLHPFWNLGVEPVHATLVGIIEPVDPTEPYWLGQRDLFYVPSTSWATLPFFVSQPSFFQVAGYQPRMTSDFSTFIYLDTGSINARNAENVRLRLENLSEQLKANIPLTTTATELPGVLASFDEKLFFTRIPLLVLVLQIAGIVLYYLFMVSTMLVERQGAEIALLKSRGATTPQVMQIYVIEGLAILGISLVIGPPLAALVISFLGQTPPFADLSGGANLSVRLSGAAYLWAAAGALLAYGTLLWPAYRATKRTIVNQRTASSRPPKEHAFTRYYLDLVLVGVGAILYFELERRGTFVNQKLFGEQSVDPLLLLTPAFFVLTVGIVFLRLFPLALRLLAWVVARAQGVALLIGMWQLVRNPVHYSRLVLLLMLATAVGMFAASFGATLNRSYSDRAGYEAGAPLRLSDIRRTDATGPAVLAPTLQETLAAEASSPILRTTGSIGPATGQIRFDLLGVEPETLGDVAFFRDDYAGRSLDSLLATLAEDSEPQSPITIPADARWLGVWVNPVDVQGRVVIELEAQDATGRFLGFTLGPEAGADLPSGWSFLLADLSRFSQTPANLQFAGAPPLAPLSLVSLSMRFVARNNVPAGTVQFDNLIASAEPPSDAAIVSSRLRSDPQRSLQPFARGQTLADFDSLDAWENLPAANGNPLGEELRSVASGGAGSAAELRFRPAGQGSGPARGLRPREERGALSVFASEAFLTSSGLNVGDETNGFVSNIYVPMRIEGSFRLFPTMEDPRENPTLLANGPRLESMLNSSTRGNGFYTNEVWFNTGPESVARARSLVEGGDGLIASLVSYDELRNAQEKDPLVAAGWEGILFISFTAILILSALGFLIYSYLTAQKRTLEFAVLRTMGFSRRQIATVVGFEQAFIISLGMIAGTLMGLRLGSLMIRYMGLTETGDEVLPPMLLHVSWLTIGAAWLVLALAFGVTIGIVVLLYSRLQLHRVLRIGET